MKKAGLEISLNGKLDYNRTADACTAALACILYLGMDRVEAVATQFQPESDCSGPSWSHSSWINTLEGAVSVTVLDRDELFAFLERNHHSHIFPTSSEIESEIGRGDGYGGKVYVMVEGVASDVLEATMLRLDRPSRLPIAK